VKLSVSNIVWLIEHDEGMYKFLYANAIYGLGIAPTRIFSSQPYDNITQASVFACKLKEKYNIEVSSIQFIWYGVSENILDSGDSRARFPTAL